MKTILYISQKNDAKLFIQALLNSEKEVSRNNFPWQFKRIELGKELYDNLSQIIADQFHLLKQSGSLDPRHQERELGNYTSLIHHLVFYK
jgi:hypothetical protein